MIPTLSNKDKARQVIGRTGRPPPIYCSFRETSFHCAKRDGESHPKIILIFLSCTMHVGRSLVKCLAFSLLEDILVFCWLSYSNIQK